MSLPPPGRNRNSYTAVAAWPAWKSASNSGVLTMEVNDSVERYQQEQDALLDGPGTLTVESGAPGIPGKIQAVIPLGALRDAFEGSEALADLPLIFEPGSLEFQISGMELARAGEIGFRLGTLDCAAA